MDKIFAPSIPLVAALGLVTLLAYKGWLSHEQEKVYTREKLFVAVKLTFIEQEICRLEAEKGCERPRLWAARWPWGLDLLLKAFWHGQNRSVCEVFYQISELSGPTHEQRLRKPLHRPLPSNADPFTVGARNIGTTSPVNLKAILDTQSKGTYFHMSRSKANSDYQISTLVS